VPLVLLFAVIRIKEENVENSSVKEVMFLDAS
jgi:hypothetical protein